ncbi:MAG: MarR family transcriptional regulator [Treponema sp.]|nr:MarR family transcriptional regulator [Treponema sp.]
MSDNSCQINPNCYLVNMKHATNALTDLYDHYLEDAGITFSQYCILGNLERLGEGSVTELASRCGLDRTTVVRVLKPLESQGFISDSSKQGMRSRSLSLTENGNLVVKKARKKWNAAQKNIENTLGEKDAKTLLNLMHKLEQSY